MVELIYIAQQISSNEAICAKLVNPATDKEKATTTATYTTLLSVINGESNLVMVERGVNAAKFTAIASVGDFAADTQPPDSRKETFSRLSKKIQVRRLDCSLSHDMTRLSFLTDGSCQLSN